MYIVKGGHDNQAESYEANVHAGLHDYIRERYFDVLDTVVRKADIQNNLSVLEIGIGTGLLTERIPDFVSTYGIDISEKMMEKAKAKGLKVELKYGSFTQIPYSDRCFDRIVSTFAFHHLTPEEKQVAFIEMDRVLKPSGMIVIGDFMMEDENQRKELIERFSSEGREDMLEELEDEYFLDITKEIVGLSRLGYKIEYERVSTLSWVLIASKF